MSFQSSVSYINPPQNFGIKSPAPFVAFNRQPLAVTPHVSPMALGNTGVSIPLSCIAANTIAVSPTTAGTSAVYTLPTAQQILAEFGEPLGATKIQAGDILYLTVVNSGSVPAYITPGTGGAAPTALVVYSETTATGVANYLDYTGATAPLALAKRIGLQFSSVSQGTISNIGGSNAAYSQATGTYSIFSA